ncbi:hypothetical protein ACFQ9Z_15690 [Streptomyces sp. NPDC056580]|uniref:hypothetical protein n=1 Tax=Streptomyces sp. NPDC056580 TaxID=3345872 RepID=UPI0036B4BD56
MHTGGRRTSAGCTGARTCHTGQFHFAENTVKTTVGVAPYAANTVARVTLDEDMLYPGTGTQGGPLRLAHDRRRIERGILGSITMAADPTATGEGGDGPGGSPGHGPSASPTA